MISCQEAEGMVSGYISNTLALEDLEQFLEHIQRCPGCMDELETYFIVQAALKQLDREDENTVLDMKKLLEQDIRKKEAWVRRRKFARVCGKALLTFIFLIAVIFLVIMGVEIGNFLL